MLKTVLFDLDGTITDPKEGISKSVAYALEKFDIHVDDLDTLTTFIGPPLQDSFMEYFHLSVEEADTAIAYYREYFSKQGLFENIPYPCVEEMLQCLHDQGITCIIATSKPEEFAKQILDHFHLRSYFYDVCGATMDGSRSEKGDVIAYAMEKHHLTSDTTIMVGDRKHDIIGACYNHLYSIGVLYGYGSLLELQSAKADAIVKNIKELKDYILSMK